MCVYLGTHALFHLEDISSSVAVVGNTNYHLFLGHKNCYNIIVSRAGRKYYITFTIFFLHTFTIVINISKNYKKLMFKQ